jgi:hypothetical protein
MGSHPTVIASVPIELLLEQVRTDGQSQKSHIPKPEELPIRAASLKHYIQCLGAFITTNSTIHPALRLVCSQLRFQPFCASV